MTTPGDHGRFDGYDVLSQAPTWDALTAGVVLSRLGPPPPLRYFTESEGATAAALLDRLLGQDVEPRLNLVAAVDTRLALGMTDGWRYADMPHDGEAWCRSLAAMNEDAQAAHGASLADLDLDAQRDVLQDVEDHVTADHSDGVWHGLPARHVWSLWTRYGCAAFYSHPWAWNEIGFGGPAYPRGYKNLGLEAREPWERPEREARNPVPWGRRAAQARTEHQAPSP